MGKFSFFFFSFQFQYALIWILLPLPVGGGGNSFVFILKRKDGGVSHDLEENGFASPPSRVSLVILKHRNILNLNRYLCLNIILICTVKRI